MNTLGRDVLLRAHREGRPQARGRHVDGEARCGLGLLIEDFLYTQGGQAHLSARGNHLGVFWDSLLTRYGMSADEPAAISTMNDGGANFATIAGALCVTPATPVPLLELVAA